MSSFLHLSSFCGYLQLSRFHGNQWNQPTPMELVDSVDLNKIQKTVDIWGKSDIEKGRNLETALLQKHANLEIRKSKTSCKILGIQNFFETSQLQ